MKVTTLFITFIVTFIFSCSSEAATTGNINWWCTQTPNYQTCKHYLADSNPSTAAISANQFLDMTVQAAINEARAVLKRAQVIESKYPNIPGKALWGSCVDYFDGIVYTLSTTVLDHTLEPTPFDVQTWLSAGLAYINVCEKGFEMINITNPMLAQISTNLTELLLNSLAISVVLKGNVTNNNNTLGFVGWNFSNEMKQSANRGPNVVVAQDGSGDFTTIGAAISAAKSGKRTLRYVIYVKSGVYEETVVIPSELWYITMYGDGINKTIITSGRHAAGDMLRTPLAGDMKNTATLQVWGRGFVGEYMTIRNTAGPDGGQSLALMSASDHSAFYRCSFEGYQDTLMTFHSRQLYKECKILGTIDFIFGDASAVFQDCGIFLRKPNMGGGLTVTAHGRKYENEPTGYSLQGCKIMAGDDLKPVIGQYNKAFLGRPWFPYGRAVFMQSFLDDIIDPQGWLDSWGYKNTAYCGEYENNGPGSSTSQRVNWPGFHDIKDQNTASIFTVAQLIKGGGWLPGTGVPFVSGFEN